MNGILNLSEAAAIGAHAAILMAGASAPLRVPDMAGSMRVSAAHLQKVLQRMVRAGLARSARGPKGGYALARPAASIRLGEVFQAIEGRLAPGNCLLDKDRCCMGSCVLGSLLHSVNEQVASKLQTRLSDLIKEPTPVSGVRQVAELGKHPAPKSRKK